jgi:hypothetical protein
VAGIERIISLLIKGFRDNGTPSSGRKPVATPPGLDWQSDSSRLRPGAVSMTKSPSSERIRDRIFGAPPELAGAAATPVMIKINQKRLRVMKIS